MKVLHIFAELKPSGGEAMMLSAAEIWLKQGPQAILSTGQQVGVFAAPLERAGYKILHLPFKKRLKFFKQLGLIVKDGNYDIVHLHTEQAALWYALAIRCIVSRSIPIVRTVHHLFQFGGGLRIKKKLGRKFMKHVIGVKFLSNSQSGKRNELARFGMQNDLAPNWYDSRYFTPPTPEQRSAARRLHGFEDSLLVFLSLGGNWEYKNYDKIVEAMALVPTALKVIYLQIGVQGSGAPLENLAAKIGVVHRVRCEGVVKDALSYLHAADVYIMPSREEGFGVAAVEAMACGIPAILSNRAALYDFRETISGIRFIEPEVPDITAAISEFAALSQYERTSLGIRQAADTRKNYGLEIGPVCYLQTWKELIHRNAPIIR